MMNRVSTQKTPGDLRTHLHRYEGKLNHIENQLGSQKRILELRDDPSAAASAVRLHSYLKRADQFVRNAERVQGRLRHTEGYLTEATNLLQRVRELAVAGSNGTYEKQDLRAMAMEVNELLEEMVSLSNAKGPGGEALFAGARLASNPFYESRNRTEEGHEALITAVRYRGDVFKKTAEVSDGIFVDENFAGNALFWAQNQTLTSTISAENFVAQQDSSLFIDGQEIKLYAGDTIDTLIHRINEADIAVEASLDPISQGLALNTRKPHQIWIEESPEANILTQLGFSPSNDVNPPYNTGSSLVTGGSIFDAMIGLRDSLLSGDQASVGSRDLANISDGLDNLLIHLADLGARDKRLQDTLARLNVEIPQVTEEYSKNIDVNMTEAISKLRMTEYAYQSILGASARVMQTSLLDFLY